jgi:5-formyltetrahydrofolate cyclo-ligase
MTGLAAIKAEARTAAFARRKTAFARGQGQAAEILADYLMGLGGVKPLSGYMPMRTESDPLPAMAAYLGVVGVPVIIGAGQPLRFRVWSPQAAMELGDFGALIPVEGAWIEPEIVIVPLLAFDARGYRLGYGGGYYDRTLEALRARRPTLAVGFGFAAQEVASVPIEPTDQRLDAMVCEDGLRLFA